MAMAKKSLKHLYTIGHSTHPIKEFISILKTYDIKCLVDIRHYPGSRHCPQFKQERLKNSLEKAGIKYLHMESLGGRRRVDKDSDVNAGWRNAAFRGYADYMQTKEFKEALKDLMSLALKKKIVIMCAEAVPWRCHRSMVGDALLVRGFSVDDIFSATNSRPHTLTQFAHVYRKKITYPAYETGKFSEKELLRLSA
jgi:uncharacterized protein (DUF488 family)